MVRLGYFLFALTGMTLTGCQKDTYDECVLSNVGAATSDYAIETAQASCKRKFEVDRRLTLPAKIVEEAVLSMDPSEEAKEKRVEVSNETQDIVTQITVVLADRDRYTFNSWLEPGRWSTFELPSDGGSNDELEVGAKIEAESKKVIPTS